MRLTYDVEAVVIYDSVMYDVGRNVRRWAERVNRRFTAAAIAEAPINQRAEKTAWNAHEPIGSLKAGISGEVTRLGPRHLQTIIKSEASYSLYVLKGTGSPIVPATAGMLRLPPLGPFPQQASSVRGQNANPFFDRAHAITGRRHSSLRPGGRSRLPATR